jgi:hypothetical protein
MSDRKEFDNSESEFDLETYMGRVKHNYFMFGPWYSQP